MAQEPSYKTLRLILGDQLNSNHSWFKAVDGTVLYVMMEVRSETDYTWHHIQKVAAFFAAMQQFVETLVSSGHALVYMKLNDADNQQSFTENCDRLIIKHNIQQFEYQLPDEYRVDRLLINYTGSLSITHAVYDTEHFFTSRTELGQFFEGKKTYLMESFYHYMRAKHGILMNGTKPLHGQWNFDSDNRKKLPANHVVVVPLQFDNDVSVIIAEIKKTDIVTIGSITPQHFIWPVNRQQSLQLLEFFVSECLPLFGTYQDAMSRDDWSLYHSRLSFSMNSKLISPREVVEAAISEWNRQPDAISYNQLEGFVRQIIGWREYMRGMYWLNMPQFASLNYLEHTATLPGWYWTGKTKMTCLRQAIGQSLQQAYAHHIQRLMITGNFALLAGIHPDAVDQWYLGIYIDALEWVEITNTRGMSQYADGGIIGTKPYVSSATYIDKMSNYCKGCYYDKNKKTGDRACPFNSLYWAFYDRHEHLLKNNPRVGMMYTVWHKMKPETKAELLKQAKYYLNTIETL